MVAAIIIVVTRKVENIMIIIWTVTMIRMIIAIITTVILKITIPEMMSTKLTKQTLTMSTGNWDFYGFTVLCKPPVLIPRPETEELVEKILTAGFLQKLNRSPRILDVGSGSVKLFLGLLLSSCNCVLKVLL